MLFFSFEKDFYFALYVIISSTFNILSLRDMSFDYNYFNLKLHFFLEFVS